MAVSYTHLITPSQLALLSYEQAIVIRERVAPYFSQLEDISKVQQRLPVQTKLDKPSRTARHARTSKDCA